MSGIEIYKALTLLEHKLLSTILQLKQITADSAGLGAVMNAAESSTMAGRKCQLIDRKSADEKERILEHHCVPSPLLQE